MVNAKDVLSVMFILKIPVEEWSEHAPTSLLEFFREHGNIRKEKKPDAPQTPRQKGEILFPSTGNCGLGNCFISLCERKVVVFSASCEEREGVANLRFMLCPYDDIEWDSPRPFALMQEVVGEALSMAAFRLMGYNNQYLKEGREPDHMRAISINGDRPNWLLQPDGQPIIENGSPKRASRQVAITAEGNFKLA